MFKMVCIIPFFAPLHCSLVKLSLVHCYLPSCDGCCHHLLIKMLLRIWSIHLDIGNHSYNNFGNCILLLLSAVVGSCSCCCTAVEFCCCCWSSCKSSGRLLPPDTDDFDDSRKSCRGCSDPEPIHFVMT